MSDFFTFLHNLYVCFDKESLKQREREERKEKKKEKASKLVSLFSFADYPTETIINA